MTRNSAMSISHDLEEAPERNAKPQQDLHFKPCSNLGRGASSSSQTAELQKHPVCCCSQTIQAYLLLEYTLVRRGKVLVWFEQTSKCLRHTGTILCAMAVLRASANRGIAGGMSCTSMLPWLLKWAELLPLNTEEATVIAQQADVQTLSELMDTK